VLRKDADRQELAGKILLNDGSTEMLSVTFIDEFDDWKVESFGTAP
jgi:dipeptidase